ncbi:MAG: hypothetical protein KDD76_04390, partial [Rickettsiales bacterium]|nr:hypothetical protein [Rickettsiales bacterium]
MPDDENTEQLVQNNDGTFRPMTFEDYYRDLMATQNVLYTRMKAREEGIKEIIGGGESFDLSGAASEFNGEVSNAANSLGLLKEYEKNHKGQLTDTQLEQLEKAKVAYGKIEQMGSEWETFTNVKDPKEVVAYEFSYPQPEPERTTGELYADIKQLLVAVYAELTNMVSARDLGDPVDNTRLLALQEAAAEARQQLEDATKPTERTKEEMAAMLTRADSMLQGIGEMAEESKKVLDKPLYQPHYPILVDIEHEKEARLAKAREALEAAKTTLEETKQEFDNFKLQRGKDKVAAEFESASAEAQEEWYRAGQQMAEAVQTGRAAQAELNILKQQKGDEQFKKELESAHQALVKDPTGAALTPEQKKLIELEKTVGDAEQKINEANQQKVAAEAILEGIRQEYIARQKQVGEEQVNEDLKLAHQALNSGKKEADLPEEQRKALGFERRIAAAEKDVVAKEQEVQKALGLGPNAINEALKDAGHIAWTGAKYGAMGIAAPFYFAYKGVAHLLTGGPEIRTQLDRDIYSVQEVLQKNVAVP